MRIDGIGPQRSIDHARIRRNVAPGGKTPSFKDTLATFLGDVNASQKAASEAKNQLIAGKITDVHQVMNKSEEAKVAFNMLMEIRNKALDGYNEIMRMRL
ncbi:MAG: flagellar hook-basal body complex protein FliE [Chitinivibrionales bacterium]|nr:flagellar hook-basal body complex protein FliE [Chitinivibrionales bacterium]MBD3357924.1 flagellar hook-basal body complex protein FliE [Chitinivibrionales bacterium]